MRKFGKLAAACALAAVLTTLTACGEQNVSAPQQSQQTQEQTSQPTAQSKPTAQMPAVGIIGELDAQMIKSKVTSADATAHAFTNEMNTYIVECMTCGGKAWESGTIIITVRDGKWSVSGYDVAAYKPDNMKDTLLDYFSVDFSGVKEAYAEIHLNESGKAFAAIYTGTSEINASEYPPLEVFENNNLTWDWDGKTAGVSPSGIIVGTCPRVGLK